jgi:hypothetical protein
MIVNILEGIHRGGAFFSFVIGVGLAVILFHRNFSTIRTLGLPLKDTVEKIVKVDGKCYRYRAEDSNCENVSNE